METGKTIEIGIDQPRSNVWIKVIVGIISGLLLVQLLNFGWLFSLIIFGMALLFVLSMNSYRIWVVLLVATTLSGLRYRTAGYTLRFDQVVLLFMIFGWILAYLTGKVRFHKVPLLIPALLYVGSNFLSSTLFSPDKGTSYQGAFLLGVYVMMYIMTVTVLREHPEKLKSAVKILLFVGAAQAVFALVALSVHFGGVNIFGIDTRQIENNVSLSGGFEEANLFGAFSAALGLMFLAMLMKKNVGVRLLYLVPGLTVLLLALILTFTRAAWVGFIVASLILIFLQKPKGNVFNPRAAAIVAVLAFTALIVAIPFANTLTSGSIGDRVGQIMEFSSGSGEGRVQAQQIALDRWQGAKIFGNGTLSLPSNAVDPSILIRSWFYSSVVQALHDTGLVGLALLLWTQIGMIAIMVRGYLRSTDLFNRAALSGFIVASVALIIASQASSFLWLGFPWVFAGLAVALAEEAPGKVLRNRNR